MTRWIPFLILPVITCGLGATVALPAAVIAGPVLCTTTLEAPLLSTLSAAGSGATPVEITRCGPVRTVPEWVERRAYSWRAPFARGVDLTHQITDFFGIAMGGGNGTKVMGLGFPDQAIVWDSSAIQNTTAVLLEDQSQPMPWRTSDLPSVFGTSLSTGTLSEAVIGPGGIRSGLRSPDPREDISFPATGTSATSWDSPVRGLW